MKKTVIVIIVLIAALGVFVSQTNKTEQKTIKIGVATILSGSWAALGENIVKTSEVAVDEINEKYDFNFELHVQDAGIDGKTGLSAAQKLVNTDGVDYIIGGTASNGTMAAAPIVNAKKIVYMTPVTGGSNVDNAGDYVFRLANADVIAGLDLAGAVKVLGYKNVAVVSEITEYTTDIADSFSDAVLENGGKVVLDERFQPGTSDFKTIVAKIKETDPEAVLILSQTGISGAHFVKDLREQGIDLPLLSDFTFVTNTDAIGVVGNMDGVYFADPAYDPDGGLYQDFAVRYENRYGHSPTIPFHTASTYDSLYMLAKAVDAVGNDHESVHDWLLENVQEWSGMMGTYSLDGRGNSDLGFVIKQIVGDGTKVLDLD